MFLVIGLVEIEELEKIVFREFPRFRNLFRQKHGSDIFDTENYQHIDPIWTCFINGKGKGYQIDNWKGVFLRKRVSNRRPYRRAGTMWTWR